MIKRLLKNWKILIWILLVVASVVAIGPNFSPKGVIVTAKAPGSPLASIAVGDTIYAINGADATQASVSNEYFGLVKLATSKGEKLVNVNGTLGLTTKDVPGSNVKFGLDVEGGIRAMLALEQKDNLTVEQTISTLQTRINLYGLREANLRSVSAEDKTFIEVSIAGGTSQEITDLLERQGSFAASIPMLIRLSNGAGSFSFDSRHALNAENGSISIDGMRLSPGQSVIIDNVNLTFEGVDQNTINFTALVFSGSDITLVYFDPQHAGIQPVQSGYEWRFQVRLSQEAAERFAAITKNLDVVFLQGSTQSYLSSKLFIYLDAELVDELNIVSDLKGKVVQEPSVTGFGPTIADASKSQKRLQSILRSGALPTKLEMASLDVISPKLGQAFIGNMIMAIVGAMAAVAVVISLRYRRLKVIVPMVITSMSEVLILFGASVVIGWTIDLAAIAGILAIVGTGIDAQIILVDQTLKGGDEQLTLKERVKRALFMIFGAGGTAIGAMLPLMVLGFGLLRGFALTTIIGVIVGIFVARPAFGEIMKILFQKHAE